MVRKTKSKRQSFDHASTRHAPAKRVQAKSLPAKPVDNAAPAQAQKNRLAEQTGLVLVTEPDENYALIDSGDYQKLERFGDYLIIRPEGQAMWQKSLGEEIWQKADAVFTANTDEEGMGRWRFGNTKPTDKTTSETWPLCWQGKNASPINYLGRFTSFRHVGVFPEQAAHWRFIEEHLLHAQKDSHSGSSPKLLNLFGYTGLASLVAAAAGAEVTHIDASKKAIGWARQNETICGLEKPSIRWICEDAVKFCEREIRRGNHYDAIVLDPPAYGRGPKGEVWQFFDDIPAMLDLCRQLLSPNPLFVILTAYTIRASSFAIHELMQEVFGDHQGKVESGELIIAQKDSPRRLSTSMFSRWVAK